MDGIGELFAPLIKALPKSVGTTIVSYPKDECLSWDELLQVVQQSIPDKTPITLVAESFSGPLAIMLASLKSHNVQDLVLCCSFASSPLPKWLRFLPVPGFLLAAIPGVFVRAFLSGPTSSSELVSAIQKCGKSVSPRVLASRVKMILNVNILEDLQMIQVPLLYLAGSQDRIISGRGWKQIHSRLPKSTLVTLDGPHLLLQRLPDAAACEIMKFTGDEDNGEKNGSDPM
jgi:pimeloyl-[acyl-carrier protein] methyl ester esterase